MGYIMVTNWSGHWDQKHGKSTSYGTFMLKSGLKFSTLKDNTPTIFIKLNKDTKEVEQAWKGNVSNFKEDKPKNRIWFTVHIDKEVDCPSKYRTLTEGWHQDATLAGESGGKGSVNKLEPPFFSSLNTDSWEEFEDNVYRLLKLIGINNVYQYDRKNQRGRADGFFKISDTAVIYDVTLEDDYLTSKADQIKNYCAQLNKSELTIGDQDIELKGCKKYVWIITRKPGSRKLKKVGAIIVKEISFQSLILCYNKRLSSSMDESELEKTLQELELQN